jgi:hypothetical protein
MSVAELMPSIQALGRIEKLELIRVLASDLAREEQTSQSLPPGFPPSGDRCPSSREELQRMRAEPGIYSLDEALQSFGKP